MELTPEQRKIIGSLADELIEAVQTVHAAVAVATGEPNSLVLRLYPKTPDADREQVLAVIAVLAGNCGWSIEVVPNTKEDPNVRTA